MSSEPKRAARHLNEPWCQELRAASAPVTRAQLAANAGMSKAKVQEILGGHLRPSMDDIARLADALNYPKLRLLALAGYLEGLSNLLTYLDQIEEQAERMEHSAKRLPGDPLSGATRIANSALSEGNFEVAMRPVFLGSGPRRRHYADRVMLRPLHDGPISESTRARVEAALYDELAWFGAGFTRGWEHGTQSLTINVPRFVALRRGTGSPLRGAPRSITVIGGHWAGSADVASFLGYAFDYDYSHVAFVASRAFSRLTHHYNDNFRDRDRLEVARTYVEGSDLGRLRVWAADTGDSETVASIIATSAKRKSPLVIHLRPTDDLLEWTAHARRTHRHTSVSAGEDLRALHVARARTDQALRPVEHKLLVLPAPLPQGARVASSGEVIDAPDAFFDTWADLAEQAIKQMHARFALPFRLTTALQRLNDSKTQV
ncbi:helix-turn-helix domain-containing protein [Streptomyces dubilierae]|uniref:Helix-turn-helix transcriptional regulator n=1 Tax=Streptomyces dubilierae TaxID=3075533 RepID=A0ABU2P2U7_9ACTN|nr:helix-turn-helix transcriptional regulator [Streptomyces sp. DSM 41921]MDT0385969.1 helix-turn-helix transcriptional regulator [Streptomyces sp. DSM 41921]